MRQFKVILRKGAWVFILGILRPDVVDAATAEAHARGVAFSETGRTNMVAQVIEVLPHVGSTFPLAA